MKNEGVQQIEKHRMIHWLSYWAIEVLEDFVFHNNKLSNEEKTESMWPSGTRLTPSFLHYGQIMSKYLSSNLFEATCNISFIALE